MAKGLPDGVGGRLSSFSFPIRGLYTRSLPSHLACTVPPLPTDLELGEGLALVNGMQADVMCAMSEWKL